MPHFSLFFIYSLHLIVDLLLQVGLAYFKLGIHVVSNELVLFDVRCELRIHFLLIDRGGLERALHELVAVAHAVRLCVTVRQGGATAAAPGCGAARN